MLLTLLLAPLPAAAQITIDDFSTNQSALTLTYPPAGTSASSSVSGSGILGGERDVQINLTGGVIAGNTESAVVSSGFFSYSQDATIAGNTVIQWDGTDGSATLNPTGLGGVDLTQGGSQDALQLSVFFDDLPVSVTIEVFTDAGNASTATFNLPGLVFSSTNFVLPYSSFTTTLGTGANFANVGAITLRMGSTTTAPDVVLDFLQTTALVNAEMTVANQGAHAQPEPGDTLRYTVVVSNPTDATAASATGVTFSSAAPANTTLVAGSVTTTQGTVTTGNTAGDTSTAVNIGTITDGTTVTVTFDVTINSPLPAGTTSISAQGTLTSTTLTAVKTDDPGTPAANDATVIQLAPAPTITTTASASVALGGSISDTATLAGGAGTVTGSITFNLYGPNDATCATSILTTNVAVTAGDGSYTTASFSPTMVGTYRWIASYGGDTNNSPSATACNDANESVVVTAAQPTLTGHAEPPSTALGGSIEDQATLAGGVNPTGTITFNLFAPGDTTCATSIATSSVTVSGNGVYTSTAATANAAGTYRWIASYSGDANNAAVATACSDPEQQATVSSFSATIPTLSEWGLASLALLLAGAAMLRMRAVRAAQT
jgi:uncharacterized repeat protein (TIGR01451 family)